jgi:hypothetical protein
MWPPAACDPCVAACRCAARGVHARARRTRFVGRVVRGAQHAILLTGTPMLSSPIEIWSQVRGEGGRGQWGAGARAGSTRQRPRRGTAQRQASAPPAANQRVLPRVASPPPARQVDMLRPNFLPSYHLFGARYCDVGASAPTPGGAPAAAASGGHPPQRQLRGCNPATIGELHQRLVANVMVRRTKAQAGALLPSKTRYKVRAGCVPGGCVPPALCCVVWSARGVDLARPAALTRPRPCAARLPAPTRR